MKYERILFAAVTGRDGRIYAMGGRNIANFPSRVEAYVEAYDPGTDTWTTVAPMATARASLAAAVGPDGTIYAFGGDNHTSTHLDTAEAYDRFTNTWRTIAPMPTARRDLAAAASVVHGIDYIFAIGGHGFDFPLATVEVYTP